MQTTNYQIVLISVPDRKTADTIAKGLVEKRLAACVQLLDKVSSIYWWENKVTKAEEVLLMAKTRTALFPEVLLFIKENHPYKVPEVLSLPISDANPAYLDWLGANSTFTAVSTSGVDTLKVLSRPQPPPEAK